MLRTFALDEVFPSGPPSGLPGAAPKPDDGALFARARTLAFAVTRPSPGVLKDILDRENRRIGADETALSNIRDIGRGTVFVIAGQQAGLFGGPLYTLYKALHVIRLAGRISETTGVRAVPVFWVASDDHDFQEVRSLLVRTADGDQYTMDYSPVGRTDGAPVGETVLDAGIVPALDDLASRLPKGERADAYMDVLRRTWVPGVRWTDAFSRQMAAMLSSRGLVLLDPRWEGVKRLFAHIMRAELCEPLASTVVVNGEADRIEHERPHIRALRKPSNSTNLFLETHGMRRPLLFEDGMFHAGNETFSPGDMHGLLDSEPERFSPAAAFRPVCQDAMMPVAAFVAGPGERVYLEQARPLYGLFEVDGSMVWPRASFTIIDQRSVRAAEKAGIPLADLFLGVDRLGSRIAAATFPPDLESAFGRLETAIETGFEDAAGEIAKLDPTLAGSLRSDKGRALHAVQDIRTRALRAHKARMDKDMSRVIAASGFLFPDGTAQERRYGMDAAYIPLGPEGLVDLTDIASPGEECHRLVM